MDISFGPGDRLRLSNDLASMTAAVEASGERRAGLLRVPGAAVQALPHREGQLPATLVSQTDRFLQPEKLGSRSALAHARRRVLVGRASCEGRPAAQGARVPNALYRISPFEGPSLYMIIYDRAAVRRVVHEGRHVRDGAGHGPTVSRAGRRAAHVHAGGAHRGGERLRLRRRGGRRGALRRLRGVRRDFPYAITQLVDEADARGKYTPHKVEDMEYSCSCFILYLGLDKRYPSDAVHSIRFASDFERNIDDIFDDARFPDDPSFYCYAPSSLDRSLAPEAVRRCTCWCRCRRCRPHRPAGRTRKWPSTATGARPHGARDGVRGRARPYRVRARLHAARFRRAVHAYDGATFGLRPTLGQSNYWRPHNKATDCNRLYFCGSSVHPGAGVPIVLLSAKLAAEELMRDDRL